MAQQRKDPNLLSDPIGSTVRTLANATEEAGGKVTDGRGNPLGLEVSSVVASNAELHDAIIEITSRHHPAS